MMYKNLLNLLTLVMLFPSCSGTAPRISVVCEENNVGNCIAKWEIALLIKGDIKVCASTDPDAIPEDIPVAMAGISDLRMTITTDNPAKRYYYALLFGDKYRVKIAMRNVNIPDIQNFRDLGGYPPYSAKKQVHWGMIYCSAEIDSLECHSRREFRDLGVRILIDLWTSSETSRQSLPQKKFNVVRIPLATGNMGNILEGIREEEIEGDTAYRMVEQMNRDLIDKYTVEYRQIFDILLDRNSYPVVIHYSSDKGRTGIVSALVLAALGINKNIIMEDYRLGNDHFNIPSASEDAYQLPARSQETITTLLSARGDFLNAAKEEAERRYDDIGSYLQKGIGPNKDETKRLRSILLND